MRLVQFVVLLAFFFCDPMVSLVSGQNGFAEQGQNFGLPTSQGQVLKGADPTTALPMANRRRIASATVARIKDITFVEGDRNNHVMGEGLVFGLAGTGGRAEQTRVMAQNFFTQKGIQTGTVETRSMSSVIVSGKIPAYARKGETIQVQVAVADDATSIRGGQLYQTVLRGIDNQIYAIAQGPIVAGGVSSGGQAASVQKNHPTVGVCEAIVEKEICFDEMRPKDRIRLVLFNKEYSTAVSIANALNSIFPKSSRALDAGTVEVLVPPEFQRRLPDFISMFGHLEVAVDQSAKVVINQKTGTVVMGQNVRISSVVFSNESLIISTAENPIAIQPAPFSQGETAVLPRTNIDVIETGGQYRVWDSGMTVGELANALNSLGVSPNLLITVMSTLRKQGALQAELVIE